MPSNRQTQEAPSISDPTPLPEVRTYNFDAELMSRLSRIEAKLDRYLADQSKR